jgi:hypothetical protein
MEGQSTQFRDTVASGIGFQVNTSIWSQCTVLATTGRYLVPERGIVSGWNGFRIDAFFKYRNASFYFQSIVV